MMIDEIIIVEGIMNIKGIPSHINVADKTILITAVVAKCPAINIAAHKILFPSCISLMKSAPIPATSNTVPFVFSNLLTRQRTVPCLFKTRLQNIVCNLVFCFLFAKCSFFFF